MGRKSCPIYRTDPCPGHRNFVQARRISIFLTQYARSSLLSLNAGRSLCTLIRFVAMITV